MVSLNPDSTGYTAYGAVAELFAMSEAGKMPAEVLLEGPAGTGKTRGMLEWALWVCDTWPGARVVLMRKTRVSMNETTLQIFEDRVLRHIFPQLLDDAASRKHRSEYVLPNGSMILALGMNDPMKLYSGQFDVVIVDEATELRKDEWESLHRGLRNNVVPFQVLVGGCNPSYLRHHLHQRSKAGIIKSLLSRHWDNPACTTEYLERLARNLTSPAMRGRLFLGEWTTAEGLMLDNYDASIHVVPRSQVPPLVWFFGGLDFGYSKAGALEIFGVDKEDYVFQVAEVYAHGKLRDWWAQQVFDLYHEYGLRFISADSEDPTSIQELNDRLGVQDRRGVPTIVRKCDKHISYGKKAGVRASYAHMRDLLAVDATGRPRLRFVEDALRGGRDPYLAELGLPCSIVEEIEELTMAQPRFDRNGNEIVEDELPDPSCYDHGCDAARYALDEAWLKSFPAPPATGRAHRLAPTQWASTPPEFAEMFKRRRIR